MKYYWNAHYAFWGRWTHLGPFLRELATAHFLASEDDTRRRRAGRAGAILLARLAHVFPHMKRDDFDSYDWVKGFPVVVRVQDYVWEPRHTMHYAFAYDLLREAIATDTALLGLDYDKDGVPWREEAHADFNGDGIANGQDLCRFIETKLLEEYARLYMEIPPRSANATMLHQEAISQLAIVLGRRDIYEHARANLLDHIAANWFINDGAYYEGAIPGYGMLGIRSLRAATVYLRRFEPSLRTPTVVQGYLFPQSMLCLDAILPNPDDAGGVTRNTLTPRPVLSAGEYTQAYLEYGDPRLLRPLARSGKGALEPGFESLDDLLADYGPSRQQALDDALARFKMQRLPSVASRSGYAVLRAGRDESPFDLFVAFDAYGGSHTHFDMFNPILYGFERVLVPDLGYPDDLQSPARRDWVGHTLSHWTVTVDRQSIGTGLERGRLHLFIDRPGLHVFQASCPSAYPETAPLYERTLAAVDRPGAAPFFVDFFRVKGGHEHLYSFHALAEQGAANVTATHATFGPESPFETLQGLWHGTPVPYQRPLAGEPDACLAYIEHVRPVSVSPGAASVSFTFPQGYGSKSKLRIWMPVTCADEFVLGEGRSCPQAHQRNVQLPYLVARSGAMDGPGAHESVFCAVIEPFEDEPALASVERIGDAALRIVTADGDRYEVGLDGAGIYLDQHTEDTASALRAEPASPMTITDVDYANRLVLLDGEASVEPGEYAVAENELGLNTFYRVERVDGASIVLGGEWTRLRVATGRVTGDAEGAALPYDPAFLIQHPIRAQCRGARVLDEAGRSLRIKEITDKAVIVSGAVPDGFAEDVNKDGQRRFNVYAFGPGDTLTWTRCY